MAKQKHFGVCHICGEYGKLSYEHIPPKAAFNSLNQRMSTLEDLLSDKSESRVPWNMQGLRYTQFQNGTGFFTLCEKCNSFTGSKYGTVYTNYICDIGQEILKIPKEERGWGLKFHTENINLLAFFKQVVSMFCSLNTGTFGAEFKDFLLNENNIDFDCNKYKICMYLHAGKINRLTPMQIQIDTQTGNMYCFSEISTFPVGFVFYNLMDEPQGIFRGCDITPFSKCDYNTLYEIDISLPFLECNTQFGLDFRAI